MPIKDRTSLLKEDAEEKLVALLYERPVTSQEITVIAGGPKNRVEYKLVKNMVLKKNKKGIRHEKVFYWFVNFNILFNTSSFNSKISVSLHFILILYFLIFIAIESFLDISKKFGKCATT